jgi:hypothetical protein
LLESELSKGFFDNVVATLKGKERSVDCTISGFYMGLISDINDVTILKIKPVNEANTLSNQLETSRNELDEFVYRTTHDLRGPLATMRGLINLMKMEEQSASESMQHLIGLLDIHAGKLDERLFNLNYLAVTAHPKSDDNKLDCEILESKLRSTIEETTTINSIDFKFTAQTRFLKVANTELTISMLNQLLLHLTNLPMGSDARLSYTIDTEDANMRVTISAEGFLSNYQLRQAVSHKDPLYTTVITYSNLINFLAAMKSADRLGASIQVDYIYEMSQQILVIIPTGKG